ncbi:MAG: ABC transporter substrate-binding protein [Methanothrix sp.]|jgi:iron complex transport system substrate-binding protein|nr:ABC transporter substrate-binding protein [Methanothrix sp.]
MKRMICEAVMMLCVLLLVMPAGASDYTLGIYGNANMDDVIDEADIAYVEGIIAGTNEATEFADANYDGEINEDDIAQIEMIISGEETKLTLIDSADQIVTIKKPLERLVVLLGPILEPMRSLNLESENIVGVATYIKEDGTYFPEFSKYQGLGTVSSPDYEAILNLHPDTIWIYASVGSSSTYDQIQSTLNELDPTITVLRIDGYKPSNHVDEIQKMGYILGKRDEADEFLDFYNGVMDTVNERVGALSEEDKPSVYVEANPETTPYMTCGEGAGYHEKVVLAGGNNIFGDLSDYPTVDPEEVITRDPDIIVIVARGACGYESDDIIELANLRDEVMSRPELADVAAVRQGRVYVISNDLIGGAQHFIGIGYLAKWFYPDLFEDLDPKAIHQEYLTRFQGLDYDLEKHGKFVYPPLDE